MLIEHIEIVYMMDLGENVRNTLRLKLASYLWAPNYVGPIVQGCYFWLIVARFPLIKSGMSSLGSNPARDK